MDDADLVTGVLAGDRRAIEALAEGLVPRLARLAHQVCPWDGELAEDLAQEAWLHVQADGWRVLRRWRGESSLLAFLLQVCRNRMIDRLRVARRADGWEVPLEDGHEARAMALPDPRADLVADCWRAELRLLLDGCLARLPERDARLLRARYFEDLDPAEIAAREGMEANAVNVATHRARRRLAELVVAELGTGEVPAPWIRRGSGAGTTPGPAS